MTSQNDFSWESNQIFTRRLGNPLPPIFFWLWLQESEITAFPSEDWVCVQTVSTIKHDEIWFVWLFLFRTTNGEQVIADGILRNNTSIKDTVQEIFKFWLPQNRPSSQVWPEIKDLSTYRNFYLFSLIICIMFGFDILWTLTLFSSYLLNSTSQLCVSRN